MGKRGGSAGMRSVWIFFSLVKCGRFSTILKQIIELMFVSKAKNYYVNKVQEPSVPKCSIQHSVIFLYA